MTSWRRSLLCAALAGVALPVVGAHAQLHGALGGVPGGVSNVGSTVTQGVGQTLDRTSETLLDPVRGLSAPQALAEARAQRLAGLVARNRKVLEADPHGNPVLRGQVMALDPTPQALAVARAAGFEVVDDKTLTALGLRQVILAAPTGEAAAKGVKRLRELDAAGAYDFNPLYLGASEARGGSGRAVPDDAAASGGRIGLIDTGVASRLPVFAGLAIEERGFATGAPVPAAHGTATASLISGRLGAFRGAAPGAALYIADIYGGGPAGGSAGALVGALEWMAEVGVPVINVSLIGPPNTLVAAAVKALSRRGARIVAAVGNDGPAAPPAYPASYPEVIAVAPVDVHGRLLPESGRALHVDFVAPGDGFEAATLAGGLAPVRGASFAAPIVAGCLASFLTRDDPALADKAVAKLAAEARPAGRFRLIGDDVRLADSRH